MMKKWLLGAVALCAAYDVTNSNDSGNGSLRAGITAAAQDIQFPLDEFYTIYATTPYSLLTDTTITMPVNSDQNLSNTIQRSQSDDTLFSMGTKSLTITNEEGKVFSGGPPTALQGSVSLSSPAVLTLGTNNTCLSGNYTGDGSVLINQGYTIFHPYGNQEISLSGTITLEQSDNNIFAPTFANYGTISTNVVVGENGIFNNNGSHTGNLTVQSSGYVTGTGQVNNVTVKSGGRIKPGNSIGTLTATGNVVQESGSYLRIEVNSEGSSSLHDVGGTFTIEENVTFEAVPEAGNYTRNFVYPAVSAAGGVIGQFTTIEEINPNHIVTGAYFLEHLPKAINLHFFAAKCTPAYLIANLAEQANAFQANILAYETNQRIMLWDRACNDPPAKYQGYFVADYANGHTKGDKRMIGSSYTIGGFQLGTNIMVLDNVLTSIYFGYSHGNSDAYNNCSTVDSNNYTGGALVQCVAKEVASIDFSVMYTYSSFDAERIGINNGSTDANLLNSQLRVVFEKEWYKFDFRPILAMRYLGNWVNGYTEKQEKTNKLLYLDDNWSELDLMGGLIISRTWETKSTEWTPFIQGEWTQRVINHTHTTLFNHHQRLYLDGKAKIRNEDDGYLTASAGLSGTLNHCMTIDGAYSMSFFQDEAPMHDYKLNLTWNY